MFMLSDRFSLVGSAVGGSYSAVNSVLSSMQDNQSQLLSDLDNVSIQFEEETDLFIPENREKRNTVNGFYKNI
jgi:hypothetical protein